jgi:hypothetical protein
MSGDLWLQSNLDTTWFRIAVEHEHAAIEARGQALAALPGSPEMGDAFDAELRASMVAVVAAAFAIDAMFTKVADLLGGAAARSKRAARVGEVIETFKRAIDLGNRTQRWQTEIAELFCWRGNIVHFRGTPTPGLPHPTGMATVTGEAATYTAGRATKAVDLALEVLTTAQREPRQGHAGLVEWATRDAHVADWLEAVRRGDAA